MRKIRLFFSLLLICMVLVPIGARGDGFNFIETAAKSVLKLLVYERANDKEYSATGSGFVAFNSSTLITNYHVIEDAAVIVGLDDEDKIYFVSAL